MRVSPLNCGALESWSRSGALSHQLLRHGANKLVRPEAGVLAYDYFVLKLGGTTSSMVFPVQCHLGTLSQTSSPFA
jgi:hypothetical protein